MKSYPPCFLSCVHTAFIRHLQIWGKVLHLLVWGNFQMSENLQGFSGNESQLSIPKTEPWMCRNHGCVPWTPHISPSAAPGLADPFSRFTEIIFQPFPEEKQPWLLQLFLAGKQQPQCCARNGFEQQLHSLFTGICKKTQLSRAGRRKENSTWTVWE